MAPLAPSGFSDSLPPRPAHRPAPLAHLEDACLFKSGRCCNAGCWRHPSLRVERASGAQEDGEAVEQGGEMVFQQPALIRIMPRRMHACMPHQPRPVEARIDRGPSTIA